MVNELRSESAGVQNMKLVAHGGAGAGDEDRNQQARPAATLRRKAGNKEEFTGQKKVACYIVENQKWEKFLWSLYWVATDLTLGLLLLLRENKFSECSAFPWLIGIEFLKKSKRILQNPSESPPSIIMLRNSPSHSNKPSVSNTNLLDWKLIFSRNLKPKSQGV